LPTHQRRQHVKEQKQQETMTSVWRNVSTSSVTNQNICQKEEIAIKITKKLSPNQNFFVNKRVEL